jgi:hypothetical protein
VAAAAAASAKTQARSTVSELRENKPRPRCISQWKSKLQTRSWMQIVAQAERLRRSDSLKSLHCRLLGHLRLVLTRLDSQVPADTPQRMNVIFSGQPNPGYTSATQSGSTTEQCRGSEYIW